jgi:ankyrin repeat protein
MSYVPLFAAVGSRNIDMIELLLERGADINARVTMPYAWQYGASAIRFAENKLHLIKFLVEHGADPSDEVAFAFAVSEDRLDIIEYLVEQGARIDVYKQDRFGNSLIKKASPRIAKYLEFAFPKENE